MSKSSRSGPDVLAQAVKQRRAELGMAQGELAFHGGPSVVVVGQIERGQQANPQRLTLSRLDAALQWPAGTAAGILSGRVEPPRAQDASTEVDVLEAIRRDTNLLPEAREHLLNQYKLLLRIQAAAEDQTALHESDADILALPSVARKRTVPRKKSDPSD